MHLGFTIYSHVFLIATVISFFVAYLAWQRRSVKGANELALLMVAAGVWTFWIIFETAALTMSWKVFWSKLEYLGAVTAPVLYFIFVLRFVGKDNYITKKNILLLFFIPVITLLLTFTNEKHYLVWSGYSEISAQTNVMGYYHGVWFWMGYMAYNYLLLLLATIQLIKFILQQKKIFSLQGWLILFASICPWLASILYLVGWNIVSGLDLTPLGILVTNILFAYAIFYTRFLDLIPIARETLVESMSDGILVLDKQNRIQDINPAALHFLGIGNKEILGLNAASCGASSIHLLNAVLRMDPDPAEQIDAFVDGAIKNLSLLKKSIKTQPGSRLIIIRDITEQIAHQEEILTAEKRYKLMFVNSPQPMWIFDLETMAFLEVNQAAISLYGYTREEFLKISLKEICVGLTANNPSENKDFCSDTEWTHLKKNGEEIIVEVVSNPINFMGRKGCHALMINITQRKRNEAEVIVKNEQLLRVYAEKDRIFNIIAHDLRSPLSTFLGLTEVLAEELPNLSMDEIQSFAEDMKNSASNVFFLLENLLNWARSQQGLIKFNKEPVNLLQMLNESTNILAVEAKNKNINIRHDFSDTLTVFADKLAIQTVIRNLVSNAVKFTNKGGEVVVIAKVDADKNLIISVKDTGIGMCRETKENLFKIDVKTNRKGTDGEPSSGLGLLLSKELIEKQGGHIWLESEEGRGSKFYFTIPDCIESDH